MRPESMTTVWPVMVAVRHHRYIPELLRAAADVRFDPEATGIARSTGDTPTSRFSPRRDAV
jgi:hypothetical protein